MRTFVLILYTVECELLFVTWMTRPSLVTATRRLPSGDHATPYAFNKMTSAHKGQKDAYMIITVCCVHLCLCGKLGDAERTVKTASCQQSAAGGNRTPSQLQYKQHQISGSTHRATENDNVPTPRVLEYSPSCPVEAPSRQALFTLSRAPPCKALAK